MPSNVTGSTTPGRSVTSVTSNTTSEPSFSYSYIQTRGLSQSQKATYKQPLKYIDIYNAMRGFHSASYPDRWALGPAATSSPSNMEPATPLKYNSHYSRRLYQPTSSMMDTSLRNYGPGSSTTMFRSTSSDDSKMKKLYNVSYERNDNRKQEEFEAMTGAAGLKSRLNPDKNNNFLKFRRGQFNQRPATWADECVTNRLDFLSQPKQFHPEYQDDRRSVYWVTRTSANPGTCNHTHFETTPRLDELAQPKIICGEFCGTRHCYWECDYPRPPCSDKDPRTVDWCRLAMPKCRYPPNYREISHVKRSALKACPTKRLCKLSIPRPVIDSNKFYLWLWHKKPDTEMLLRKVSKLPVTKCYMENLRIMIRCDLDPQSEPSIEEKVKAATSTIKYALEKGAQSVVIVASVGEEGNVSKAFTLKPLVQKFEELLERTVLFLDDCVGYPAKALCEDPEPGTVFLLENIAFHPEEWGYYVDEKGEKVVCKPEDVEKFRTVLFDTADTYVVDAFPQLVHMNNTTIGYPKQEKAYGFNIKFELDSYNRFIVNPKQPMIAIVGGEFSNKVRLVRNLMGKASEIILGGHIANVFLAGLKNVEVGTTKFTRRMLKTVLNLHTRAKDTHTVILLPSDVVVRNRETEEFYTVLTREDIDEWFDIVDIGPFTRKCYVDAICRASTILWAGEMGILQDGTKVISTAFSSATEAGALTYIADEETKAAFRGDPNNRVTHVSYDGEVTMLLLRGILPKGLAVLNPYRRKVKKRTRPEASPSKKPVKYEIPGLEIASGEKIMCINDVDVEDKKVLIRVDFDVPMNGGTILNNYRIRMTIPTIKYAIKWRARAVIIVGHMGAPEGTVDPALTLKPVCDELASLLGQTVVFVPQSVGDQVEAAINQIHPGSVMMLENIRFNVEETGVGTTKASLRRKKSVIEATPSAMANFCAKFTNLGDIYVNDAFACLHQDHSSIMSYYKAPRTCGFLVKNELKYMARIFNYPRRRFMVVLGGIGFKDKLPLLQDLMKEADNIILAGLFGPAFLKVTHNVAIGATPFDPQYERDIRIIAELADYYQCRLHYPVDFSIAPVNGNGSLKNINISEGVPEGQVVVDIGYLTMSMFSRLLKHANMVLWMGVIGKVENEDYAKGTKTILDTITEITNDPEKNVISFVAGRSNTEYIHRLDPEHTGIAHLTTGGNVALKLLNDRQLIGLDVLTPKPSKRPINVLSVESVDLADKRVLMRADLNVPIKEDQAEDTFSLRNLVSTIKFLQKKGAKSVVLVGHRGRPEGKKDESLSLKPLQGTLATMLDQEVTFVEDGVSDKAEILSKGDGRVLLLENVRFHPEEEGITDGPENSRIKVSHEVMNEFRKKLTSLGDIYVNESFSSLCHPHSSVVGVLDKIQRVAGPNLKKEITRYVEIRNNMEPPILLILGGDDSVENVPRLYRYLDFVNQVIVCGDLAFTMLKCNASLKLGKAPFDKDAYKLCPRITKKAQANGVTIHLPFDYVCGLSPTPRPKPPEDLETTEGDETVAGEPEMVEEQYLTYTVDQGIPDDHLALDLGAETVGLFTRCIAEANTILWDGVISSYYEYDKFQVGTKAIIQALQKATANGAATIAMGMKTGVCLGKLDAGEACSMYSTGVQSCFDILRKKTMPGLQVLQMTPPKPLRKLSIDKMTLKGMRVLMRLDLFVPTVEGVVLDTDKLEEAAPTIKYALNQGAKAVVLLAHRGNPNGYKNHYLSLEPLVVELNQILEKEVTFIDRPCSNKAKNLLADPKAGSVFLMENLKFYPAEYGRDAEPRPLKLRRKDEDDTTATDFTTTDRTATLEKPPPRGSEASEVAEEEEEPVLSGTESTMSVSDGEGGRSIDSLMFQLMVPKTVADFKADLAACADVYVNDDVTDLEETLTSLEGFGLQERGCGFLLMQYIQDMDDPALYNLPNLASLSPAPL